MVEAAYWFTRSYHCGKSVATGLFRFSTYNLYREEILNEGARRSYISQLVARWGWGVGGEKGQ